MVRDHQGVCCRRAVLAWDSDVAVGSVLRGPPLPHVHPDHAVGCGVAAPGQAAAVPVVNRADFHRLEGVVGLPDILGAYDAAGAERSRKLLAVAMAIPAPAPPQDNKE